MAYCCIGYVVNWKKLYSMQLCFAPLADRLISYDLMQSDLMQFVVVIIAILAASEAMVIVLGVGPVVVDKQGSGRMCGVIPLVLPFFLQRALT